LKRLLQDSGAKSAPSQEWHPERALSFSAHRVLLRKGHELFFCFGLTALTEVWFMDLVTHALTKGPKENCVAEVSFSNKWGSLSITICHVTTKVKVERHRLSLGILFDFSVLQFLSRNLRITFGASQVFIN
jgi:hypothetical protein